MISNKDIQASIVGRMYDEGLYRERKGNLEALGNQASKYVESAKGVE
jgi:hypothetical protein